MKFFHDTASVFECTVKIEGASTSKSEARLILYFENRTLMFSSDLIGGKVSIKVPALREIEDSHGRAVLEVIAESSYFPAWRSDFDLENKKSVSVQEVQVDRTESAVVTIENIENFEYETRDDEGFIESCSPKNEQFASNMIRKFSEITDEEFDELQVFVPNDQIETWARSVFENPTGMTARYCMSQIQKNLDKE